MSAPSLHPRPGAFEWLPRWLRPREREQPGSGRLRRVEIAVLVLVGLLLAVATVNDVARQTGIDERLNADLRTWRTYTHHDYKNVAVDQHLLGSTGKREVVCGNDVPGPPKEKVQICLIVEGPTVAGRRSVGGGWYLVAHSQDDVRPNRYGCFGTKAAGFCAR